MFSLQAIQCRRLPVFLFVRLFVCLFARLLLIIYLPKMPLPVQCRPAQTVYVGFVGLSGCAEYSPLRRALTVQAQSLVGNIKSIFGADVQCFTMKNPLPEVTGQTLQRTSTHAKPQTHNHTHPRRTRRQQKQTNRQCF